MIRPPSWTLILLLWVGLAAAQQLAATGHPLVGGLIGLTLVDAGLVGLGWMGVRWARLRLAERRERRGHPDEEAAVRAARFRLGVRGDRP